MKDNGILMIIGRTLEETAALFDGEEPHRQLTHDTREAESAADVARANYPMIERPKADNISDEDLLGYTSFHVKSISKSHSSHSTIHSQRKSEESV